MSWSWIVQAAAALVVLGGAFALIVKGVRWVIAAFHKWNVFLEDWHGEPARHGRPAVPGVMERLVILEEMAREVRYEVKPNSGASLKDQITRIEEKTVPPEERPS